MCTHMTQTFPHIKVSKVTSLPKNLFISKGKKKEFVFIQEFIYLQMHPLYYHLRKWSKQIVLRSKPNKKDALINFSGPLAQLSCLYHVINRSHKTRLQITPFCIKTGKPLMRLLVLSQYSKYIR